MVDEFPQAQVPGEGGRQEQAGIGHQAVVIKGDADTASIYWVLLVSGRFCVPKPLSQEEHPPAASRLSPRPSLGGFGFRRDKSRRLIDALVHPLTVIRLASEEFPKSTALSDISRLRTRYPMG